MAIQGYARGRLPQLFEELGVSVLVIDRDEGMIRYINAHVRRDLGKAQEDIQGKPYRQIFYPEFIPVYESIAAECVDSAEHTTIYYWAAMQVWEQITASLIVWEDRPAILLCIMNVTELARSKYMAESRVYFDPLLGLPNGLKLEEDISDIAESQTLNLIYFIIERFDEINDIYGWENGDALLRQVRDWLLATETQHIHLYRVGNGFVMLGRDVTYQGTKERAKEILRRFQRPWTLPAAGDSISLFCGIRIGILHEKYVKNEMRNILRRVLNTPKTRDGFSVYDEAADQRAKAALMLRDSLINCIHDGMRGFSVSYQPIVDVRSGEWVAAEALCRWTTPDGGNVPPSEFIPLAEQLGLIGKVDDWVHKEAMLQCASLGLGEKRFVLNINFSPKRKVSPSYVGDLRRALLETGYPACKLNLEITESAKMDFSADNLQGLKDLINQGIMISLDDFGTGYSSFENLIQISASVLKIEKLFMDDILRDSYRRYLLELLVSLTEHLRMGLVAEGVETKEQFALLKDYHVRFAQGYLFSRPLPFAQLQREAKRFGPE